MKKPIYLQIATNNGMVNTQYNFKKSTVADLSLIIAEMEVLKLDIIKRIDGAKKTFEVKNNE